jgi:hypothetical protein
MTPRSRNLSSLAATRLTLDPEPYLSCDDCFEQIDVHVEALLSGAAPSLTPQFRAHLIGCAACRDEARSLTELVALDVGVDPETARARFDRALASQERRSP